MFLCAEMMLQGVALNLVAFARFHGNLQGQVFVLFILTVAACEAGWPWPCSSMLYRRQKSLDVEPVAGAARAGRGRRPRDDEPLPGRRRRSRTARRCRPPAAEPARREEEHAHV